MSLVCWVHEYKSQPACPGGGGYVIPPSKSGHVTLILHSFWYRCDALFARFWFPEKWGWWFMDMGCLPRSLTPPVFVIGCWTISNRWAESMVLWAFLCIGIIKKMHIRPVSSIMVKSVLWILFDSFLLIPYSCDKRSSRQSKTKCASCM